VHCISVVCLHYERMRGIFVVVALLNACRQSTVSDTTLPALPDSGATYVPGATWRRATPAQAGFDSTRIAALERDVSGSRFGAIDALIVVRFGHLVVEKYNNWPADRAHTMQSVSKSVTSLLFGILQSQRIDGSASLDRRMIDVLRRYEPFANDDVRKQALTLRHLLMMRTDMDFFEQPYLGSPLDELNRSTSDWTRFIVDRPMTGRPGDDWAYNSGAAILTCAVIRELTGENADAYARRELFAPIGVVGESWFKSPYDGLPHCGGGLNLRPIDMTRVGYLVLRRGRWGDRQLVPSSWIDSSTAALSRGPELIFASFNSGYGYFWWTFPVRRGGSDAGVIAASGSGGQWIFIVPSLDLVVAVAASNGAGLDLLYDGVIASLR
jgi:CubicO group peptidase (beta-lactamase class C family)